MKLQYLLKHLFIVLLLSQYSDSQAYPVFAPVGTKWTFAVHNDGPGYRYPFHMVSTQTLTYDGMPCSKLVSDFDSFYAYRDSLKMYIHSSANGTHWQLLFDFAWTTSQQAYVPITSSYRFLGDSALTTVTGKGDTVINGVQLPYLMFGTDVAVLNMGWLQYPFLPSGGVWIPEFGISFRCYEDATLGLYKNTGVGNCDTLHDSGVDKVNKNRLVKIIPNPATDKIQINYAGNLHKEIIFSLTDITGRSFINKKLTSAATVADISFLPAGLYIYRLSVDGSIAEQGKALKE